ncbi:MAG TPA: YajQ family cyclic di-GMP-binding protein [Thermoanaerobaculia bacterium]|nr:YajQ family cyclic di-GMP-binding protein [Thermoanaerobaculia bacterium]
MAAAENSFDIVSTVDLQEVRNAVQQAEKEIANRYDLKKAAAVLRLEGEEITLEAADDFSIQQALDVLQSKLVKRGVNLKSLRYGKVEPASGSRARQKITLQQGIPIETAKKIVAEIKTRKLKVQAAIQADRGVQRLQVDAPHAQPGLLDLIAKLAGDVDELGG